MIDHCDNHQAAEDCPHETIQIWLNGRVGPKAQAMR